LSSKFGNSQELSPEKLLDFTIFSRKINGIYVLKSVNIDEKKIAERKYKLKN